MPVAMKPDTPKTDLPETASSRLKLLKIEVLLVIRNLQPAAARKTERDASAFRWWNAWASPTFGQQGYKLKTLATVVRGCGRPEERLRKPVTGRIARKPAG